jgi:hypothetical protein
MFVPTMKRWRPLLATLTVLAIIACGVAASRWRRDARLALEREAHYQASLRSYSGALRIGATRKEVEAYLRSNGKPFRRMCCMPPSVPGQPFDVLTQIGTEPHPWYCNEHNVYIGFAFAPKEPRLADPTWNDSDTLRDIRIFHWLEDCL